MKGEQKSTPKEPVHQEETPLVFWEVRQERGGPGMGENLGCLAEGVGQGVGRGAGKKIRAAGEGRSGTKTPQKKKNLTQNKHNKQHVPQQNPDKPRNPKTPQTHPPHKEGTE